MNNNDYTIRIHKNISQELVNAWKDLWDRSENATLFNSYNWFKVNQATINIKDYEVITCFKDEKLKAVLPLYWTKKFGIRVAGLIGYEFVSTPFLFEDYEQKLIKLVFDFLRKRGSFYLAKVHVDAIKKMHDQYPDMLYTLISVNPYLSIKDHPELINSNIGKKSTRKLLRRYSSNLRFTEYDQKTDLINHLHKMFELEQKSEKKQRNMDIFSSPANRAFYENIVKYCKDFIQIHFLYFDDQPIAYTFNLCYKNILFGYQTAYLSVSGKKDLSPGKLMLLHSSNFLKTSNFERYEMSCGISTYKLEFASDYYCLYDIYYSQNFLVMLWWRLINFTRRLKQILFPLKYTRDHEFLFRVYPSLP
jgi:CelD/BcsL family acetyltransferase involved in cellulose biosynthesis